MKVLILANFGMGLYNFRKELILKLIELDYKVYISIPEDDYYYEKLEKLGCVMIPTELDRRGKNLISEIKLIISYFTMIRKFSPSIVLTYTIKPTIYGGLTSKLFRVPYISNVTGLGTSVVGKGILKRFLLKLYGISLKYSDKVFFQNKSNKEVFSSDIKLISKAVLLPGSGVNLDHYTYANYPLQEKEMQFVFISRILKEKGIDLYLQLAEKIKTNYPKIKFLIVGFCEDDGYKSKLQELENKNIIKYLGQRTDIDEILKCSHCLVHPTYYPEGMSNVMLEAAASGRPVIASDKPGCKEIVDDRITGFLFEEKNEDELYNKTMDFIVMPHQKKLEMGKLAREKIEREFNRSIVVDCYIKEIHELTQKEL